MVYLISKRYRKVVQNGHEKLRDFKIGDCWIEWPIRLFAVFVIRYHFTALALRDSVMFKQTKTALPVCLFHLLTSPKFPRQALPERQTFPGHYLITWFHVATGHNSTELSLSTTTFHFAYQLLDSWGEIGVRGGFIVQVFNKHSSGEETDRARAYHTFLYTLRAIVNRHEL